MQRIIIFTPISCSHPLLLYCLPNVHKFTNSYLHLISIILVSQPMFISFSTCSPNIISYTLSIRMVFLENVYVHGLVYPCNQKHRNEWLVTVKEPEITQKCIQDWKLIRYNCYLYVESLVSIFSTNKLFIFICRALGLHPSKYVRFNPTLFCSSQFRAFPLKQYMVYVVIYFFSLKNAKLYKEQLEIYE